MVDPFEEKEATLETGFYYDKDKNLICLYCKQEGGDNPYEDPYKIYNRSVDPYKQNKPWKTKNSSESNLKDLVSLKVEVLTSSSIDKDFNWIFSNEDLSKSFIEYLLGEEEYLILELFKTFVNSK